MLVGLHTCGDLASTLVRSFIACKQVECLLGVGCCYHRLSQHRHPECGSHGHQTDGTCENDQPDQSTPDQEEQAPPGFPMSRCVRELLPEPLGKSMLSLATHSTVDRIATGGGTDSCYHSNFCRAAFQALWLGKCMPSLPAGHKNHANKNPSLSLMANKFPSFTEYARAAMKRAGVEQDALSDTQIMEVHDNCYCDLEKLRRYVALRRVVAPIIESLILLDRQRLIEERCGQQSNRSSCSTTSTPSHPQASSSDVQSAIIPLFDASISPRSFAIFAARNGNQLLSPDGRTNSMEQSSSAHTRVVAV
mmetsp:Transcript_20459/g.44775  ORF Transcript_20459/g.44775 Transcript_20459/m.44775 type:complete len:306 (-) Transcript_20459:54-971(-)